MRWSFDRARAPLLLLAVLLAAGAAHGVFDESGHGESASRSSLEFQAPTYNWFLAASPTVETQKASTTQRSTKWYNDFKTPQSDDILVAGMDALRFKVTLTSGSGKAQLDKLFEPLELARRLFPVATAKFVSEYRRDSLYQFLIEKTEDKIRLPRYLASVYGEELNPYLTDMDTLLLMLKHSLIDYPSDDLHPELELGAWCYQIMHSTNHLYDQINDGLEKVQKRMKLATAQSTAPFTEHGQQVLWYSDLSMQLATNRKAILNAIQQHAEAFKLFCQLLQSTFMLLLVPRKKYYVTWSSYFHAWEAELANNQGKARAMTDRALDVGIKSIVGLLRPSGLSDRDRLTVLNHVLYTTSAPGDKRVSVTKLARECAKAMLKVNLKPDGQTTLQSFIRASKSSKTKPAAEDWYHLLHLIDEEVNLRLDLIHKFDSSEVERWLKELRKTKFSRDIIVYYHNLVQEWIRTRAETKTLNTLDVALLSASRVIHADKYVYKPLARRFPEAPPRAPTPPGVDTDPIYGPKPAQREESQEQTPPFARSSGEHDENIGGRKGSNQSRSRRQSNADIPMRPSKSSSGHWRGKLFP